MVRWWFGSWPPPKVSAFFQLSSGIGITLVCLQDTNKLAGPSGSALFFAPGWWRLAFAADRAEGNIAQSVVAAA